MDKMEVIGCHDCWAEEGQLHDFGCDVEECPFCGWQLISCHCCYKKLRIDYSKEPIYSQGLDDKQEKKWIKILEKKGRIPFIVYPNVCVKCGKLWPNMFSVPDEEWEKYIAPSKRGKMVCKPCYDHIKNRIDKNEK